MPKGSDKKVKTEGCPVCGSPLPCPLKCHGAAAAEIAALKHDVERQMTIANEECNRAEGLKVALDRLIVAVDWEVPAIRDGVDAEARLDILMECAREARGALARIDTRSDETTQLARPEG